MTHLKILNQHEKHGITAQLKEQFAIESIQGTIIMLGSEKLFLFSGNLSEEKIRELEACAFIERIGVYLGKIIGDEIRLSIEGTQILSSQIKKNTFSLDSQQAEEWMMGRELPIKTGTHGFLIMKHGSDFLGTGKASESKIGNFIPKNRRLRERQ